MMRSRRRLLMLWPALALPGLQVLTACQTNPTTGKPEPPTLEQVKAWLQTVSEQLPGFIFEAKVAGLIKPGAIATQVDAYVTKFQTLVTAVLQLPPGTNAETLLNDVLTTVAAVLALIPQTAAFVPLFMALQMMVIAFLNGQAVTDPSGHPVPAPTPPAADVLTRMHANTLSARHH